MASRYFSSTPITGDIAVLADQESRHLMQVMRAQVGDSVTLFDGSGAEFRGIIKACRRDCTQVEIVERRMIDREASRELTLAVALPKGDRQRTLIEKCTELGVTRVVPLETARGVAQPTAGALDRLHRSVVEASKQCGRNRLMEIGEPTKFPELSQSNRPVVVADPSGRPMREIDISAASVIAIGPEGGFSPEELQRATDQAWPTVSLGARILRVETAAIALAASLLIS